MCEEQNPPQKQYSLFVNCNSDYNLDHSKHTTVQTINICIKKCSVHKQPLIKKEI